MAVNTLNCMLALYVGPANEDDYQRLSELAKLAQIETGESVEIAYVITFKRGARVRRGSHARHSTGSGQLLMTKRGFVLLPKHWVVERGGQFVRPSD